MESQTPKPVDSTPKLRIMYWIAAAAMTISIVIDVLGKPVNWLSVAGRVPLVVALVLLATARPAETHAKKLAIYGLLALSIGLLLYRIFMQAASP